VIFFFIYTSIISFLFFLNLRNPIVTLSELDPIDQASNQKLFLIIFEGRKILSQLVKLKNFRYFRVDVD
jgi:hypothetical protein